GMGERRREIVEEEVGIRRAEVSEALKKVKMGKASGIDGVCGEMLKYGGEIVIEWVWKMCRLAWEEGSVPEDWKSGVIVPLYKGKGERGVCGNYRGICLLSVVGKVYCRVVIERVRERTEKWVGEEQGGFRKGRGCVDQIFSLRCVVEKCLEKGQKVYAAFMDLEKAYDRIDREGLWKVLRIYGVPGKLLRAVKSLYEGARAAVRVESEQSEFFELNVGLKQGCVMSPWLFSVYMDGVMKEIQGRAVDVGVPMMGEGSEWKLPVLLFADDTVLLSDNEWELQGLVNMFRTVCERRNLKVNVGKSKVMVFERGAATDCEVRLNGQVMANVSSFKYLGSVMSKDGGLEDEMQERVQQGKRVVGTLKSVTRNRAMSMEVKKTLHDSVVIPTLTYGSEAWTMTGRHKSRVRGVEMSYLRSACGVTWRDRLTNEEVRERCNVDVDVLESVKRNTLRWFGHVERMGSERLVKKVYESEVEGRRGRGRPRTRWKDGVKRYMSEGGVGWEEGRQLTRDRNAWRQFICGHPPGD
ncbi:MAG: reverse transcriptase family protein, partial [Desulfobulbaceae bacterium]|nr:reverse transcriptase family protein [Desulfobulbaceae bacterium]